MIPKHFVPTQHHYRRVILTTALVVILSVAGIWTFQNHQALSAKTSLAEKTAAQPTTKQVTAGQAQLKHRLQRYLDHETADGTTSISFYNLGPQNHTTAAKSATTRRFYHQGDLAVASNAHTPEISASTYKLFMAAYMLNLHHQGLLPWTPENQTGFEQMIVHSENDFAEDTLNTYGLESVNAFIGAQKWYVPVFVAGNASQTTAYSLTLALKDLALRQAPFNHRSDQKWLLSLMRKQVYRTGIPAGAAAANKGTTVADKVGWYADTNNDAGIVTLPNGQRYVLTVMTHGHLQSGFSGFPRIAKITTHIQKMVYDPNVVQNLKE